MPRAKGRTATFSACIADPQECPLDTQQRKEPRAPQYKKSKMDPLNPLGLTDEQCVGYRAWYRVFEKQWGEWSPYLKQWCIDYQGMYAVIVERELRAQHMINQYMTFRCKRRHTTQRFFVNPDTGEKETTWSEQCKHPECLAQLRPFQEPLSRPETIQWDEGEGDIAIDCPFQACRGNECRCMTTNVATKRNTMLDKMLAEKRITEEQHKMWRSKDEMLYDMRVRLIKECDERNLEEVRKANLVNIPFKVEEFWRHRYDVYKLKHDINAQTRKHLRASPETILRDYWEDDDRLRLLDFYNHHTHESLRITYVYIPPHVSWKQLPHLPNLTCIM